MSSQPPDKERRWRARDTNARVFVATLAVRTVRAVRHGFLQGGALQKGNLTRYTPYLARQLTVYDYR